MKYLLIAGHGEHTKGKRSPDPSVGVFEWEFNRSVAERVAEMLQQEGIDSEFLNPGPIEIPLGAKVAHVKAENKQQPCTLLAIHANASGSSGWNNASGARMFVRPRGWGAKRRKNYAESRGLAQGLTDAFTFDFEIPYSESTRSVKDVSYKILKVGCPAVLIECGFMTHKGDAAFMASETGRDIIARTIAGAVKEWDK